MWNKRCAIPCYVKSIPFSVALRHQDCFPKRYVSHMEKQGTILEQIVNELEPNGIRCTPDGVGWTCTTGRGNDVSVRLHPEIGKCGTIVLTLLWFDLKEKSIQYPANQTVLVADRIMEHMNDGVL